MAGDTDNVRVWLNADVYVAPVGSTAPTDTTTALDAAFEAIGLLSEDGSAEGREEETADHYAWGGILVRTTRSKHKRTLKVTALEDTPVVFDLANPGSTAITLGSGETTRTVKAPTSNPKALVLETVDGDVTTRRYVPNCEAFVTGEIEQSESSPTMVELTFHVYPDADGVLFYDITNDPQADTGS